MASQAVEGLKSPRPKDEERETQTGEREREKAVDLLTSPPAFI